MFFIFDSKKPAQLIFYIFLILFAIALEYLEVAPIEKTIGVGIFAVIFFFVFKIILGLGCCSNQEDKEEEEK